MTLARVSQVLPNGLTVDAVFEVYAQLPHARGV
jgi:hypothetical protein